MTDTLFPGLDTYAFPGLQQTAWLMAHTNAAWINYYLPAPSHAERDWLGQRAGLIAQGWGLAPLYVGQQLTGPGSRNVTAAQGATDGRAAAALMKSDGWPTGACLYLDIEEGPPARESRVDYCAAWARQLVAAGYRPGFYCSHSMAPALEADLARRAIHDARWWVYMMASTEASALHSLVLPSEDPDHAMIGATAVQHAQKVTWLLPGAPHPAMLVDLDTSVLADPSAP